MRAVALDQDLRLAVRGVPAADPVLARGDETRALRSSVDRETNMFELKNEASLIATFRYSERGRVELSRDLKFPMVVDDYVTWPFGKRVFLVFAPRGDVPRGIVFEASDPGPPVSHMCDWCLQGGLGVHVGLLTARRSRLRSAGILVCSDLGCRGRLEHVAERSGMDAGPPIRALLERMRRFADSLDFGPVLS